MIVTPGGMTTLTRKLSSRFSHPTIEEGDEEYDLYVAVDVGDEELLNEWKEKIQASRGMKVLVDHHPLRDNVTYDRAIVDEGATSAAEVVFALYQELGVKFDGQTAQALLDAIMFDSRILPSRALRG